LRNHDHWQCPNFTEAEIAMGLLDSDKEWGKTLDECSSFITCGQEMIRIFCVILSKPGVLWNKFKNQLSNELLYEYRIKNSLLENEFSLIIYQQALLRIHAILRDFGKK